MPDEAEPFDPNLKDAMTEMMKVAEKYDIGAFVCLGSRSHGEFQLQFPSWSLAKFEPQENDTMGIRIKAKSGITNHEDLEATVAFIMGMRDTCAIHIGNMDKIISLLKEQMVIEHDPKWSFGNQGH